MVSESHWGGDDPNSMVHKVSLLVYSGGRVPSPFLLSFRSILRLQCFVLLA